MQDDVLRPAKIASENRRGADGMTRYVLEFHEIDRTQVATVGGKGAHLGDLSRIEGVHVPPGFCVTTDAFGRAVAEAPMIDELLDALSRLEPEDRDAINALTTEIRRVIEGTPIPNDVAAAIIGALTGLGEEAAYAVRSSATAEDLPTSSFAGQHDTYLNIVGAPAILQSISRCWASLFTALSPTASGTASTTARLRWPWSCSRWSSPRSPGSCSPPNPSPATGRS
jgi:pyruvate,water dikinase